MHLRFVLLALAVALTTTACAGLPRSDTAFEDWEAAYESGDYATALRLMRPLADQGDAVAPAFPAHAGMNRMADI